MNMTGCSSPSCGCDRTAPTPFSDTSVCTTSVFEKSGVTSMSCLGWATLARYELILSKERPCKINRLRKWSDSGNLDNNESDLVIYIRHTSYVTYVLDQVSLRGRAQQPWVYVVIHSLIAASVPPLSHPCLQPTPSHAPSHLTNYSTFQENIPHSELSKKLRIANLNLYVLSHQGLRLFFKVLHFPFDFT